jgi:hypothetical protein
MATAKTESSLLIQVTSVPPRNFDRFLWKYDNFESFNCRKIQGDSKPPNVGRTVSLFTKHALYGHHYLITNTDTSSALMANSHAVLCAHMHL